MSGSATGVPNNHQQLPLNTRTFKSVRVKPDKKIRNNEAETLENESHL